MQGFLFVVASALLRGPKGETAPPSEAVTVTKHESVDPSATLAAAERVVFGSAEEACSYCFGDSFNRKVFPTDPATGESQCLCVSYAAAWGSRRFSSNSIWRAFVRDSTWRAFVREVFFLVNLLLHRHCVRQGSARRCTVSTHCHAPLAGSWLAFASGYLNCCQV